MNIKLFNLLKKFDILDLLNIEDSYFNSFVLKKRKKLSNEVVLLNYSEFSPYSKFDIYHKVENERINLWYTNKGFDATVVIPESTILFKYFLENKIDGLIVFDTTPQKLLVIKDNQLKRQFSKNTIAQYEMNLIQKEFSVDNCHVYSKDEYQEYLDKGIECTSIKDILNFFTFEFNFRNLLDIFVQKVSIPISVFIFILLVIEGLNYAYVQDRLTDITQQYSSVKEKTQDMREKINVIEDRSAKYFSLEKEFKNNSKLLQAMQSISKIIKDTNTSFLFLRISENEFRVKVDTNQTSKVFTEIVGTGYFENLKIQSAVKNRVSGGESVIIKGEVKW